MDCPLRKKNNGPRRDMKDFAPSAFEQEVLRVMCEKDDSFVITDVWCGECGKYRYGVARKGKTTWEDFEGRTHYVLVDWDYLCLTCRLASLPKEKSETGLDNRPT